VELIELADKEIHLAVHAAEPNASLSLKLYAYPLWHAYKDDGEALPLGPDDWGLMQLAQ
jgi:hypothetical protein